MALWIVKLHWLEVQLTLGKHPFGVGERGRVMLCSLLGRTVNDMGESCSERFVDKIIPLSLHNLGWSPGKRNQNHIELTYRF